MDEKKIFKIISRMVISAVSSLSFFGILILAVVLLAVAGFVGAFSSGTTVHDESDIYAAAISEIAHENNITNSINPNIVKAACFISENTNNDDPVKVKEFVRRCFVHEDKRTVTVTTTTAAQTTTSPTTTSPTGVSLRPSTTVPPATSEVIQCRWLTDAEIKQRLKEPPFCLSADYIDKIYEISPTQK